MNELDKQNFTPLQQELLKLFAINVDESDLIEIKFLLINYFSNKLRAYIEKEYKNVNKNYN